MTTPVDLCNRALSEMGTQSSISSLGESSPEGVQCALWYDTLRKQLLRTAPWGFARRQAVLTLLGTQETLTAPWGWVYKYLYPADCLKFRYMITPPTYNNAGDGVSVNVGNSGAIWPGPSRQCRWMVDEEVDSGTGALTKTILSNVQLAIGAYTMDVTNCDRMDELFQGALTSALAYKLIIPLSGDVGMRNEFKQAASDAILAARVVDGNEALPKTDHSVDWISARMVGSGYGLAAGTASGWGNWFAGDDNMAWGM